ncbi:MAG: hypothetical protein HQK92_01770 [Nitrospirae bacterium]|nr:hypothetical protein [Nitrospirota bacterium]
MPHTKDELSQIVNEKKCVNELPNYYYWTDKKIAENIYMLYNPFTGVTKEAKSTEFHCILYVNK